ncbi:hypothetical protein GCM10027075_47740 [Streptomyces heilongjiangensis]
MRGGNPYRARTPHRASCARQALIRGSAASSQSARKDAGTRLTNQPTAPTSRRYGPVSEGVGDLRSENVSEARHAMRYGAEGTAAGRPAAAVRGPHGATPARVNVRCVTPVGEETASTV